MAKRFYWLKLKDNFYSDLRVKKLLRSESGCLAVVVYQRLMLNSMNDGGYISFKHIEETFAEEIALELDLNADDAEMALSAILKAGLLKKLSDDEYVFTGIEEMVGSESESAERVRKFRQKQDSRNNTAHKNVTCDNSTLQSNGAVTGCDAGVTECSENVTLEKRRERDR